MFFLYANCDYKISDWISAGMSYDDRKNYYTYEIQSLADSLFDSAMRHGLRGCVNFRLPAFMNVFGNFGLRKRKTNSENTYFFAAGVNKANLTSERLNINLFGSGFSNFFSKGYHVSLRIGKYFRSGHDLNVEYGNYSYKMNSGGVSRTNQWFRLNGTLQLFRRFYLTENYEYHWGSDMPGHRIYSELGYRF